jgi:hypothetical protein
MSKVVKAPAPKAGKKKLAAAVEVNTDTTITRKGYVLHFVKPNEAKKINELVNTGKVVDNVAITCSTTGDKTDELIIVVKK